MKRYIVTVRISAEVEIEVGADSMDHAAREAHETLRRNDLGALGATDIVPVLTVVKAA